MKKISGDYGYIDLFWPRIVLVEHKSAGKDLGKAESQAFRYIQDLAREGRHQEIPRYVIVSDFARVALHDLEPEDQQGLPLFDNRRVARFNFRWRNFTSTSAPSPSFPATSSINFRRGPDQHRGRRNSRQSARHAGGGRLQFGEVRWQSGHIWRKNWRSRFPETTIARGERRTVTPSKYACRWFEPVRTGGDFLAWRRGCRGSSGRPVAAGRVSTKRGCRHAQNLCRRVRNCSRW